jgi:hypothetical protein
MSQMPSPSGEPAVGRPTSTFFWVVVLIAVVAGWVASIAFMVRVGGDNPSIVLQVLFAAWVSSPFICLAVANTAARHWASATRTALHLVSVAITAGSVATYAGVVSLPTGSKPAFAYLVVPLLSWLLLGALIDSSLSIG